MSVFSIIGQILTKAVGIVTVVINIGKQVLPFIGAARQMVPAIDDVCDKVETVVDQGQVEADDFFDRNLPLLEDLREVFHDLQDFARAGEEMVAYAIQASQVDTPDEITLEEAKQIALRIDALRKAGVALGSMTDLEAKINALD